MPVWTLWSSRCPKEDLDEHLRKVRAISAMDKEEPHRKSKSDKSDKGQRSVTANKKELGRDKGPEQEVGEGPGSKTGSR